MRKYDAQPRAGFDADVGGALLEGVLPQPIDDIDDVLVIGVKLAIAAAEVDQLLERRQPAGVAAAFAAVFTERARL